jgi:hypothetical protein
VGLRIGVTISPLLGRRGSTEHAHRVLQSLCSGSASRSVPYWDAVAALNTPTESYSPSAADRRDEFLSAAIAQL